MKTSEDAVNAIRQLHRQLIESPESWENPTLDRFLEAMAAWLEDSGKAHHHEPSWELIIQILQAGKMYE
jgi:hypothetical protein